MMLSVIVFSSVSPFLSNDEPKIVEAKTKYKYTGWKYHSTLFYNKKVRNLTVAALNIYFISILPNYFEKAKAPLQIANLVYQANASTTYSKIVTYRKYVKTKKTFKPLAGERTTIYVYKDKSKKKLITKKTKYKYTSFYKK
ncbi:hypothetical protein [Rummeliibacillus sp. SL167]|uniref:hypothetical protein n=2 Tax=Rummeliibacillus TaxID=648802 RepID=UPI0011B8067A|nr:hypothetical protein [Rummeliibacillus sp. SL167]